MKWKRSKKAISESHKKQENSQGKSITENDDFVEADIADEEDDSDIDISDDPALNIDQKSEMVPQLLCDDDRSDLQRNLGSMDLSRSNPYLQGPHLHPQRFQEETNSLNSAVS